MRIQNLTDLAGSYVAAERTKIWEYSITIEDDERALRDEIVRDINPLLRRHGAQPLDPKKIFPDLED